MKKNIFPGLFFLLYLIDANCQLSIKKEKDLVILYDNNLAVDTLYSSPGKLYDYKIISRNHLLFILEVRGLMNYKNMSFNGNRWFLEKSSNIIANHKIIGSVPRNNEDRKVYQYKIIDIDKVEKFDNGVSVGFVDFEKILKMQKERMDKMDRMWEEKQAQDKKNKKN